MMAKRVSPHPLAPIVTLSRTAQAPSPPSGRSLQSPRPPQPPPLCPSPSPTLGPLLSHPPPPLSPPPLLHVGSEQIRLHVSLRGTCRGTGSGPAPLFPDPPNLRVQASSAVALPSAWRGVSGLQCLADRRSGSPLLSTSPLSLTPLYFGGASLGSRSFCAAGAPVMRGPRGKEQQRSPGFLLAYALMYWGFRLGPNGI